MTHIAGAQLVERRVDDRSVNLAVFVEDAERAEACPSVLIVAGGRRVSMSAFRTPRRFGEHRHAARSTVDRRWAHRDPEAFWARAARELPWFRPWDSVFEWTFPTFRWFVGAETNLAYNALDRHVAAGRGGHTALDLLQRARRAAALHLRAAARTRSKRVAAALRGLGIGKGDRLTIYMPTCARGDRADARDGSHRRDPLGGLRRLRRQRARRSDQRQRLAAGLHRRRHLSQGQGGRRSRRSSTTRSRRAAHGVEHVVVLQRGRRSRRR